MDMNDLEVSAFSESDVEQFFSAMRKLEVSAISESKMEQFFADMGPQVQVSVFSQPDVEQFFSEMGRQVERAQTQQSEIDRKRATGFNVFDFIQPNENKLSFVLAWLLDPQESHGQGDLFLRLLFNHLNLSPEAKHTVGAKVHREAPTFGIEKYRRRMDVLVEASAWVAIENKVDSVEQPGQAKDILEHLHRCTGRGATKSALIYLTPNGRKPTSLNAVALRRHEESGRLKCWNYHDELRSWLNDCLRDCEAQKIRDFLTYFLGYIESKLKRESENQQGKDEDDN